MILMQHSFPVGHCFSGDSSGVGLNEGMCLEQGVGEGMCLEQGFVAYFSFLLVSLQWKSLQDYSKLGLIIFSTKDWGKKFSKICSSLGF